MRSAHAIRLQIEGSLARKIPSALTPSPRLIRPTSPTGVAEVDTMLDGGLPIGALTEIVGPQSSGRTSLALSFVAKMAQGGKVCAWVDVCDSLRPEAAAAAGVPLSHLLWIRCGMWQTDTADATSTFCLPDQCFTAPTPPQGLHGGGCGTHPREEAKGLAIALGELFENKAPKRTTVGSLRLAVGGSADPAPSTKPKQMPPSLWSRLEQALKVTDLLLQGGGFGAVVLDMASLSATHTSRIPLSHWFRYRAAAEHSQAAVLLLTQAACTNSSAGLQLRLGLSGTIDTGGTVFAGHEQSLQVQRQRSIQEATVVPLKKPVAKVTEAHWANRASWAGRR